MKQAIIRLVVLGILLLNQALILFGWNPLPFSEDQIYESVSTVAAVVMAIYTWYKDNPVTKKGKHNDKFLRDRGMK
ncbi:MULTISPECIES: phage holin [unclassified Virgibacillus]|uniref:phage holin n=1 Tax=unclassified Virgibacillus TaxID=2620237 RepID=UPI00090BF174|nr:MULTISPECIES: phage holin [unclassified Virgibacillus]API92727.1 phage holin [Virgibacillus sp. 6R]MBS7428224.1 phage holin [Virgibacillus sp. 19R1-5]